MNSFTQCGDVANIEAKQRAWSRLLKTSTLSPVSEDGFKAILRQFPSRHWMFMRAPHLHEPSTLSYQRPPSMQEVPFVFV